MLVFGLTGGIACGKSTVARAFEELGVATVDADQLSRLIYRQDHPGYHAVTAHFGERVLDDGQNIDRQKLAKIIFANPDERSALERMTHPLIAKESAIAIEKAKAQGFELLCYEASLLIETGRANTFRPLVVVTCDPNLQRERLQLRDGLTDHEMNKRLTSQMPLNEKQKHADFLIVNDHDATYLKRETQRVWSHLMEWTSR